MRTSAQKSYMKIQLNTKTYPTLSGGYLNLKNTLMPGAF